MADVLSREDAIVLAIEYMGDMFELSPDCKTEAQRFGEWIFTRHFSVKGVELPYKLISQLPTRRKTAAAEMLEKWQSGNDRTPVSKGKRREYLCDVYRDAKGRKTLIQDMYAPILEGLEVVRYDGPGFKGAPLIGLKDGEPVAVVMPWEPLAR